MSLTFAPQTSYQSQPGLFGASFPGGFGLTMPSLSLNPQAQSGGVGAGFTHLFGSSAQQSYMNADADGEPTVSMQETVGANPLGNGMPTQSFVFYPIPDNQFVFYPESVPMQDDDFDTAGNIISTGNEAAALDGEIGKPKTRDAKVKSKKKNQRSYFKTCWC